MSMLQPQFSPLAPPPGEGMQTLAPPRTLGGFDAALRHALRAGELRLDFQPLVAVATGRTAGFEALLRWRRPGQGDLDAAEFIAAAERSPVFDEIGAWTLREAARALTSWPAHLRVTVNLSAAQLRTPLLSETVRALIDKGRLDPRRLELEIAESAFIDDFAAVAATLCGLRREGVKIALDDFGGSHSSLTALARLPLDRLKIDRAFIVDALLNPRCAAVIRAAARLARELGLTLTGEGVETCQQLALLRSAGCDEAQGYFYSRPLPESELAEVYESVSSACPGREDCRHCPRGARN
jgi:EAL domain-containing protein (putative c-di-GMP-specific phosphodiesterase class I)